ncbi:MAG: aspartate 1-decarboxylase [Bacillota bacterium]
MMRLMCRAKIHRATVTDANLNYVGSVTIDEDLLKAADIIPYEQVQVANINNGARFETYAIPGPSGSGMVCVNGAAARLAHPGDLVIIITYGWMEDGEAQKWRPKVVHVDGNNKISP